MTRECETEGGSEPSVSLLTLGPLEETPRIRTATSSLLAALSAPIFLSTLLAPTTSLPLTSGLALAFRGRLLRTLPSALSLPLHREPP